MKQVRTTDIEAQRDGAQALLREDRGPVALLTLNRPDARNSLSDDLIAALRAAIAEIGSSDGVRAVVITGAGSAFSSGHDLKELTAHRNDPDRGRAYFAKIMGACSELMLSIVRSPKPVIAAVNGIATAAGCQLVAACDLAVASREARFATPGVNIGLFCSTPMVALSRNLSRKAAMEMLLLGDMVTAAEAQEFGLVNRVVEQDETVIQAIEVWTADREQAQSNAEDRQGGLLPAARNAARRGLRFRLRRHGGELAACRGGGRNWRLFGEATTALVALIFHAHLP